MTGIVTDDDGNRVPNARVSVEFSDYRQVLGASDAAGVFRVDFTARDAVNRCAAFAWADKAGYDVYARYLCPTTLDFTQRFLLHGPKQIAAGESTAVTVVPDDTICYNDLFDEPVSFRTPWVCRSVHIAVPVDGIMTVEALPDVPVVAPTGLGMVYGNAMGCCVHCCEKRLSIPVTAGADVLAAILMDAGSSASQSFTLNTSLARR